MTNKQKLQIENLKEEGFGYKKIAELTGLSKNTISSYFKRKENNNNYCIVCGMAIATIRGHKKRKYCSNKCRYIHWINNNVCRPKEEFICFNCGKTFNGYKSKHPKFCSRDCYYHFRKEMKHE